MGLFGSGGFFDRAGDWLGGAAKKVGGVLTDAAEWAAELPNDIINLGVELGRRQDEIIERATNSGGNIERSIRERRTRQFFADNGPILLGAAAILAILVLKK